MTMKRGRRDADDDDASDCTETGTKRPRHERMHPTDSHLTDLLKSCLQKVCELQADLERESDEEDDAEAAGYAACAMETLRFLASEGLTPDHPVIRGLSQQLLR